MTRHHLAPLMLATPAKPLKGVKEGKWSHDEASDMVAKNYKGFCDLWIAARK